VIDIDATGFTVALEPSEEGTGSSVKVHVVKKEPTKVDGSDMLEMATSNLRCVDWETLLRAPELFAKSVRDETIEEANEEAKKEAKEKAKEKAKEEAKRLYGLSRPPRKGEKIDYFISHAWNDSGTLKYDELKKVAESFYFVNLRYPTFWFDKVCFDQNNLSDGLKVLPINVMVCEKILVLCGATYSSRLWCVWEIFTLLSFADMSEAIRRLEIRPLNAEGTQEVNLVEELASFDVANARCYDPNEEAKIRRVIDASGGYLSRKSGSSEFNEKIHQVAEELKKAEIARRSSFRRSLTLLANANASVKREDKIAAPDALV